MRWRSSGVGSDSRADGTAAAPLDKNESGKAEGDETAESPSRESQQQVAGSSISTPLAGSIDVDSSADGTSNRNGIETNKAIDPSAESSASAEPEGDPPYASKKRQTPANGENGDSDEEDLDALPALEAVSPDDDDDDDTGDDHEVPWKPQATQSTCEFTHTIVNYSQKRDSGCKKAEYSATTVDEFGNRWRLIVYVNGNGRASNHHLSLFLQVRRTSSPVFRLPLSLY